MEYIFFTILLFLGVVSFGKADNGPVNGYPLKSVSQSAEPATPPVIVKGPLSIHPRSHPPLFEYLGIFPGSRQCGGNGRLLTFRSEACIFHNPTTPADLCAIPAGPVYTGEVSFVAGNSFKGISALGTLSDVQTGNEIFRTSPIWFDLSVEAGMEYEVRFETGTTAEFKGRTVRAQYIISRGSGDKGLELCAEAMYQIA